MTTPATERTNTDRITRSHWAVRASLLWKHRRPLSLTVCLSLPIAFGLASLIPKQYTSTASIMPPDDQGSGALMLAALAGHGGLGSLGGLASSLLGARTTTALFVGLLESGTVRGHLIDRFDLQHVYHSRYRITTAKHLAHQPKITDDKKSGVITIEVEDTNPVRARDMAQAYLDELNQLVNTSSTSAARQERIFIEHRLDSVQSDLERAQLDLSNFSSSHSTIDIKEQTRAMVDAGARVQGELMVEQSSLQALRQIYGDENIRVKETKARIDALQGDLARMTGSSAPLSLDSNLTDSSATGQKTSLYPSLRQMPRLAVPYADLYRRVMTQEAVFELLTQQYEMARIEEAKDVPVIRIIDSPGIPEKKSFPPRVLLALILTLLAFVAVSGFILMREAWQRLDASDPRKILASEVVPVLRRRWASISPRRRTVA